jgi:hypothetical protein
MMTARKTATIAAHNRSVVHDSHASRTCSPQGMPPNSRAVPHGRCPDRAESVPAQPPRRSHSDGHKRRPELGFHHICLYVVHADIMVQRHSGRMPGMIVMCRTFCRGLGLTISTDRRPRARLLAALRAFDRMEISAATRRSRVAQAACLCIPAWDECPNLPR